ncbi:DUF3310 domain-containing protein [Faecalibaculum rodentium]|uniref:DUF3310 domain-containing protein n=2 Tax=Faecalibaculum rodentium TaxID=1702221 RepID=UPI002731C488|nr:DUF3310 domain-containing protein [Faecalibaculum rodentium]
MTKKELLEELNDILDSFLEFARFKYKIDDWEKNEMVVEVFERIKYEIVQRLEREEAKAAAEKVKAMLLSLHEPEVVTPEPGQIWRSKSWKRQVKVVDVFNMGSQEPLVTYKYLDGDYIDWIRVNRRWYLEVFEFVRESEDDLHKNPENLGTSSEPSQKVGTCQKTPISESLQQEDCKKRAFVRPSHETPEHYRLDPEPIAVIKAWDLGFCLGNVIKYLARAGHKPGESRDKDLHKAMEYLRMELEDQADAKESTAARRCC